MTVLIHTSSWCVERMTTPPLLTPTRLNSQLLPHHVTGTLHARMIWPYIFAHSLESELSEQNQEETCCFHPWYHCHSRVCWITLDFITLHFFYSFEYNYFWRWNLFSIAMGFNHKRNHPIPSWKPQQFPNFIVWWFLSFWWSTYIYGINHKFSIFISCNICCNIIIWILNESRC